MLVIVYFVLFVFKNMVLVYFLESLN